MGILRCIVALEWDFNVKKTIMDSYQAHRRNMVEDVEKL